MRLIRSAVARVRIALLYAVARAGGPPFSAGTVDAPPRAVARDIRRLWWRNTVPWSQPAVIDPRTDAVVTLTTHGARLFDVWLAIESIGRGDTRPGRLLLWLDQPGPIPWRLRRLQGRGLEVRHVEPGWGVHTKYWPYLAFEQGEVPLVLSDDDIVYPPTWLSGLLAAHRRDPDLVIAYRAHVIGITADGQFLPYATWRSCDDDSSSFRHFATAVSGTLLPVHLQQALRARGDHFLAAAPSADDVWINAVAVDAGIRTRQVGAGQQHWWFIPGSQETGLNALNVVGGANDRQMEASHTALTRARIAGDPPPVG